MTGLENPRQVRTLAIHLPQFHPTAENDAWWGPGFTEWTNVAKTQPLFPGHNQPELPGELGFCDMRLPDTWIAQAELARTHGIDGFAYYHYWFEGKRLLNEPIDRMRATGLPDFPFCLIWANETWSRRWLGEEREILIKQTYSERDDLSHADWLVQLTRDPRYIRHDGRALFVIYRPLDLPDPAQTVRRFRDVFASAGEPDPYLVGCNAHCPSVDFRRHGFDDTLDFLPSLGEMTDDRHSAPVRLYRRIRRNLRVARVLRPDLNLHDYAEAWRRMRARTFRAKRLHPLIPSAFVGWDNSPRRGKRAAILVGRTPEIFQENLRWALERAQTPPHGAPFLFINAWNEWAEGNNLEPSLREGRSYLEVVKRVLAEAKPTA